MKLINCLCFFLLLSYSCSFSQSKEIINSIYDDYKTDDFNYLNNLNDLDFSRIWLKTKEHSVYGVLGKNHQRIRIKFISIKRNPDNKNEYLVYGKSKVKS